MSLTAEIRCTRCESSVPWAPFCSRCGAYLEFAGDPPWHPAEPQTMPATTEEILVSAAHEEPVASVGTEDFSHLYAAPQEGAPASATRAPRSAWAVVIGLVVFGVVAGVGLTLLTNGWIGGMSALVCLAWAIVLLPRARSAPDAESAPVETREIEVIVSETLVTDVIDEIPAEGAEGTAIEARAPQFVPTRAIEVPVSPPTSRAVGDVPCPQCGGMNFEGRHFCQWCGAVMPNTLVSPITVPHIEQVADDEVDSRGRRVPRVSRSWRGTLVAATLAFVFLSAILVAVFGPFAFQFRLGTTQVFQAINQFIDPYSGNQPNILSATATSSLEGASPEQLAGDDASTFWASAPSFIFGAGNSVTVFFDREVTIDRAVVLPGIQNGLFDPLALATPATVTLSFDDGTSVTQELELVQSQSDYRQLISFPRTTTLKVTMRIDSVYPPRKGSESLVGEVAVSGLYFLEPPQPPSFLSVPTKVRTDPALPGTTN